MHLPRQNIEVYAKDDKALEFRVKSDAREAFFKYIGPDDSLAGYQRSYKLVFYKVFFMRLKENKETYFDEMKKNFNHWVLDNEFYEYVQSILIPSNKILFESILKAKTAKELEFIVENYELEQEINELNKNINAIQDSNKSFNNEKLADDIINYFGFTKEKEHKKAM